MDKRKHASAPVIGGVKVAGAVIAQLQNNLDANFFNKLSPISKANAKRKIGQAVVEEIEKTSRKLKFFVADKYLFIKDGNIISHCFSLE